MDKEAERFRDAIIKRLNGTLVDTDVDVIDLDEYESYLTIRGAYEIADVVMMEYKEQKCIT